MDKPLSTILIELRALHRLLVVKAKYSVSLCPNCIIFASSCKKIPYMTHCGRGSPSGGSTVGYDE